MHKQRKAGPPAPKQYLVIEIDDTQPDLGPVVVEGLMPRARAFKLARRRKECFPEVHVHVARIGWEAVAEVASHLEVEKWAEASQHPEPA